MLRDLYPHGADWIGTDLTPKQIEQARLLADAAGMKIDFRAVPPPFRWGFLISKADTILVWF